MHKSDLIEALAERTGLSKKQVESFLEAFQVFVIEKLKAKEEITLTGFGTFSAKTRGSRMGVNPQNPSQKIQIPEVVVPKFKAGKALKDALKGK
ncbi:MAG: hypothetical protein A3B74_05430 [Candidatus Kerfeldbacteria bacterium RIFCSPHIGHO2_02_FULL_42_14]|uniref:DNA-binding protein n=1 Tax=Candidatus Kerfeldbacteria bacterium RIFCSPHIGHO2_02_FULL_42_14 TaxID=1798540 RepID=A0A1G2AVP5_9BACT|nr:MAG: hypothetical protein A3B74_05430 [Candidatus Kerfeldbacteria bacterium RIFCSPHIGHO2_02_FULL_42_14]OGY81571.1 MAG: hypothetical protein A3E60_01810 [Candidatus Kerfeldbacteria bacterium RIFCSPHIGHO2_12_FULL_42_13]OGY83171.1 MAG: hypothetical protein A3I91_03220 [Candidatus Kerfeldbacteria bacterium RIFCSPLOWO2_02_FULL_42_19]OGY86275.1 MAG: hypothetical protein A3G01_00395 [Candidatus Kerfeldbacteria bacterium RIFCSPLOWO2_12_FULL_43_9]